MLSKLVEFLSVADAEEKDDSLGPLILYAVQNSTIQWITWPVGLGYDCLVVDHMSETPRIYVPALGIFSLLYIFEGRDMYLQW